MVESNNLFIRASLSLSFFFLSLSKFEKLSDFFDIIFIIYWKEIKVNIS